MDTAGEGKGGMIWESRTGIYTLSCVKFIVESSYITQGVQPGALLGLRGVGWGEEREVQEGKEIGIDMCMCVTDSYCWHKQTQHYKAIFHQLKKF